MTEQAGKSVLMRFAKPLITVVCLALVATVLWQMLPKAAFSSDLSQLGQGRPALVMLREVHMMGGDRVLEQMQALHPEFEQDMVFLVVHTGNPDGVGFAAEHQLNDGSLVAFSATGQPLNQMHRPESTDTLRRFIVDALAADGRR